MSVVQQRIQSGSTPKVSKPNPLVEDILERRPTSVGNSWVPPGVSIEAILVNPVSHFFSLDPKEAKIGVRIGAKVVTESNGVQRVFVTEKPSSDARPVFSTSVCLGDDIYPVEFFDFASKKPVRSNPLLVDALMEGFGINDFLHSNGLNLRSADATLKVRGVIAQVNSGGRLDRPNIKIDERNIADLCEDPSLIGRLSAAKAIRVSAQVHGLIVPVTLVPDVGPALRFS